MAKPGAPFSWSRTLANIATGQVSAYVKAILTGPMLLIAGVMLALSWVPFVPIVSTWHAKLSADHDAQAEVIGHRYVCTLADANQVVERGYLHLLSGESACHMRSESVLRFVDAAGAMHEVVAPDPYWKFLFLGLTPRTEPNPYQRLVPLVRPAFFAEAGAPERLDTVMVDGAELDGPPGGGVRWSQRQALALRGDDPLLFEALAWLGLPPDTKVALRYDAGDPKHAWLSGLFDQPGSQHIPILLGLVLGPMAISLVFLTVQLYAWEWRRWISYAITALAVLSTPFWAPRFFELVDWFSQKLEVSANLREDFEDLDLRNDRRTAPPGGSDDVPLRNTSRAGAVQAAVLEGLIPPRPKQSFATLGAAYEALCAAAGERFATLEREQREQRYAALAELRLRGVNGPGVCLFPAALRELEAWQAGQAKYSVNAYTLLWRLSEQNFVESSFAGDYARDRQVRERAKSAIEAADRLLGAEREKE